LTHSPLDPLDDAFSEALERYIDMDAVRQNWDAIRESYRRSIIEPPRLPLIIQEGGLLQ
jgi:hypothetical protein